MLPTQPSKQPNSEEPIPATNDAEFVAEMTPKIAAFIGDFHNTLQYAAAWRRGELPERATFAYLWRGGASGSGGQSVD